MGRKSRKSRKKILLGGQPLGSTRKDPYNLKTWEPTQFTPFDFKPVTGVTGKKRKKKK